MNPDLQTQDQRGELQSTTAQKVAAAAAAMAELVGRGQMREQFTKMKAPERPSG